MKAEKLYYTVLIGYIWYEAPDEEKNFTTLLKMINASEVREDDEDFKNPIDLMFDRLKALQHLDRNAWQFVCRRDYVPACIVTLSGGIRYQSLSVRPPGFGLEVLSSHESYTDSSISL